MKSFNQLIEECEGHIRSGRADLAAKKLAALNTAEVPRESRLPLATLCRRASLTSVGLRLLAPIVHPERNKWRAEASQKELAEYAVLLFRNGSTQEALITLDKVDAREVPEQPMYRGFCHIFQWEYDQAADYLQVYLDSEPAAYSAFVARVNLAAALVSASRLDEALKLLDANIETARANDYHRLLGNCFELRAQVYLRYGDYKKSRGDLSEAAKIFGSEQTTTDQLFVAKWQSVLESIESRQTTPLVSFREKALALRHWESVRDTDFYFLKVAFEQERFEHLLFGTPYGSYRKRLLKEMTAKPNSDSFLYGAKNAPCLDLSTGELTGSTLLKPGQKSHQLLTVLLKDFYKPIRLGGLFAELFPDEKFDIFTSPNRIHQLLFRTRHWLESNQIPVALEEVEGNYSLRITGEFSFRVALEREAEESHEVMWRKLNRLKGDSAVVSAKEAREALGMSRSAFHRLSVWALETGLAQKQGNGNAVRYRISDTKIERAA